MTTNEIWNRYYYLRKNNKTKKPLEILIPNDIFKRMNDLVDGNGKRISSNHKAFAFAVYVFSKVVNSKGTYHKISEIKEVWGYSSDNKSVNEIVKKDGILDKAGITSTKTIGLDEFEREITLNKSTKIQYKDIEYDIDTVNGGFFKVYSDMMLACMLKNKELGAMAFYIYAFICYKCQMKALKTSKGYYEWEHLSVSYINLCLGLSTGVIKTNIKALLEYKLIKTKKEYRKRREEGYSLKDANLYYPATELIEKLFSIDSKESSEPIEHITKKESKESSIIVNHRPCLSQKEDMELIKYITERKRLEREAEIELYGSSKVV